MHTKPYSPQVVALRVTSPEGLRDMHRMASGLRKP